MNEYKVKDINSLIPYINNSRTHDDNQINQIAGSIKEFGFTNPVLIDEQGGIIAGHGRVMAAQKLSMDELPTITLGGLTEAQKKAYIIADNQLPLNAGWDLDKLKLELETLTELDFDLNLLGFDDDFIDGLLIDEVDGLTDEDAVPETPLNPVTVLGDIWTLGNHRLMCGDSTSIDAVDLLMDGQKADMVFTDPPYGVDYSSQNETMFYGNGKKGKPREKIKNDITTDIYTDVMPIIKMFNDGVIYIFCGAGKEKTLLDSIENNKMKLVNTLVWDKMRFGGQCIGANYKPCFELFYYIDSVKGSRGWSGPNNEETIWRLKRDNKTDLHPTQKPVELAEKAIKNHSVGIVMDLFGGAGFTLIACEKLNRQSRLMELDEKYCDVIIKRWEEFTGKEARHIESGRSYKELKAEKDGESAEVGGLVVNE